MSFKKILVSENFYYFSKAASNLIAITVFALFLTPEGHESSFLHFLEQNGDSRFNFNSKQ